MIKVRKSTKRVKTRRKQISKSTKVKKGGRCRTIRNSKSMRGGNYLYKSKAFPEMAK